MCRTAVVLLPYCTPAAVFPQAYDEFKKVCRSYTEAFVSRCFVFEPSEEHIRQVGQRGGPYQSGGRGRAYGHTHTHCGYMCAQ